MNLQEAYKILELPNGTAVEEVKKQFKKLGKKFHPDNKVTGDESKFKEINAAHEFITKPETRHGPMPSPNRNPFVNFDFSQNFKSVEEIKLKVDLTFSESVLGCKKQLKYKRKIKCRDCNGDGMAIVKGTCDKCNGLGQVVNRRGNMMIVMSCDKCGGKRQFKPCDTCSAEGTLETESDISINIPGGVSSSTILRCQGKGNFFGNLGPMDQYTDAFVELNVESDPDLVIENGFVVHNLSISLLEAIRGCKKTVKTVLGNKEIDIKVLSRNKDEILIPRVGINGSGFQKVILDVKYPDDTKLLIDSLVHGENSKLTPDFFNVKG